MQTTLEKVKQSVRSFPNRKVAGPDGFCIKFYKAYVDIIAPFILRMFNHSISIGLLPETLYSANISPILKKEKKNRQIPPPIVLFPFFAMIFGCLPKFLQTDLTNALQI